MFPRESQKTHLLCCVPYFLLLYWLWYFITCANLNFFSIHLDKSVVKKKCLLHCVRGRDYHANTFCRRQCSRPSRIHWFVEVGCCEESSLRRYAEGRKNTKTVATPTFPISKVSLM